MNSIVTIPIPGHFRGSYKIPSLDLEQTIPLRSYTY